MQGGPLKENEHPDELERLLTLSLDYEHNSDGQCPDPFQALKYAKLAAESIVCKRIQLAGEVRQTFWFLSSQVQRSSISVLQP